ncbi:unnamed protein product [Paramecium primaurelia]|uniref:Uncharacterized protein n=1 Tax=Paramecium primaurelia TaxID=5886 RepID=A0A8S1LBY4_PARPR|nr:unnamed protein product [Paramecium primaurelia]
MGTCVQSGNQKQNQSNTYDQVRLNENRHVQIDPKQQLEWKVNKIEMQISEICRKVEEFQKQQLQENQNRHHQMKNLNDSENDSSNLQVDLNLRSLNFQVQDKTQQRNSSLFESEKKQQSSFTQGLSQQEKNHNLFSSQRQIIN